jgi:hypothetical protein
MTAGDVLDGAVAILKYRPRVVLTIVAVFVIPTNVVVGYLQRDILGGASINDVLSNPALGATSLDSSAGDGAAVASLVLGSLSLTFSGIAIGILVGGWYSGVDQRAGEVLAAVARRWWVGLVAWFFVHLLELVGTLLLILPGLAAMALLVVTSPVIGAEGAGPFTAMSRSMRLTGRRFFRALGLALLSGFVVLVTGQILAFVPTVLALVIGLESGWVILAVGGSLAGLVTTAMQAGAATLIYFDLRVRTEGLDLELRAVDLVDDRA